MPIYEYECPKCGRFEVIEKVAESPSKKSRPCETPGCKEKMKRVMSASAFVLKGSGWYKTDYSSSNGSSTNGSAPSDSSSSSSEKSTKSDSDKGSKKGGGCGSGCGCH